MMKKLFIILFPLTILNLRVYVPTHDFVLIRKFMQFKPFKYIKYL